MGEWGSGWAGGWASKEGMKEGQESRSKKDGAINEYGSCCIVRLFDVTSDKSDKSKSQSSWRLTISTET